MTLPLRTPMRLILFLVLVGASLFALVYSRSAPAAPTVTWVPSSLTVEVGAGQSSTTTASFTTSESKSNVTLSVVPELAAYVTVTPATFASVTKGVSNTIQVTFAPSATATPGTYEGTIHVKQGSKTLAKPLPVILKITENATRTIPFGNSGISISYPQDWQSDGDGVSYISLYSPEVSDGEFSPPSVFMQFEKDALSVSSSINTLDEYALDENFSAYAERKHLVVDGHDTLLLDDRTSPTPHRPYVVAFVDVSPSVLVITAEYTTIEDYMMILESIQIQ